MWWREGGGGDELQRGKKGSVVERKEVGMSCKGGRRKCGGEREVKKEGKGKRKWCCVYSF